MIHERLAVIGLPGLKEFRESGMRRRQRFGRKHFAEEDRAAAQPVLLHQHGIVHRLRLARASRSALLVVVDENRAMRHQLPAAAHSHPFMPGDRRRLPRCAGTFMRRGQFDGRVLIHIHAGHVVLGRGFIDVVSCGAVLLSCALPTVERARLNTNTITFTGTSWLRMYKPRRARLRAHILERVSARLDSQRGYNWRTIGDRCVRRAGEQVKLEVVRFVADSHLCNHRMQKDRRPRKGPLMPGRATLMVRSHWRRRRRQMAVTPGSVLHLTRRIRPTGDGQYRDRKDRDQHSGEHIRSSEHCSKSR